MEDRKNTTTRTTWYPSYRCIVTIKSSWNIGKMLTTRASNSSWAGHRWVYSSTDSNHNSLNENNTCPAKSQDLSGKWTRYKEPEHNQSRFMLGGKGCGSSSIERQQVFWGCSVGSLILGSRSIPRSLVLWWLGSGLSFRCVWISPGWMIPCCWYNVWHIWSRGWSVLMSVFLDGVGVFN